MIGEHTPTTTLAVSDLDRARTFYEGVLGLTPTDGAPPVGVLYAAGSGRADPAPGFRKTPATQAARRRGVVLRTDL